MIAKNLKKPEIKKRPGDNKKNVVKNKAVKAVPEKTEKGEKGKKIFQVLRGMHDVLPKEEKYWKKLYHIAENAAEFFQFGRIETPLLEEASLFVRSIGKGTDVVDKEMYIFEDRDKTRVCLRPEATASAARAYIGYGFWNNAQPVKMWYYGSMFRHDRPQAGRYRELHQIGFETFGSADAVMDAELILVAYNIFKDFGLSVEVHVNSIGTLDERQRYKTELVNYYRSKRSYLCADCRERLSRNPMRLLDCKEPQCQPIKEDAPQIVDWLGEESKNHFMKVLEYLDELSVPYVLRPTLVRGLDYYTHTVFEIYTTAGEGGAQSALAGGGRYNLLIEELGGRPTPAAGFALGVERTVTALKEYVHANKIEMPGEKYDLFFAHLGEDAKRYALGILNNIRNSGLKIAYNFSKGSLKTQLEIANSLKVNYVLILGQKEVQDKSIIIRDMESGVQEIVDQKKVANIMLRKLGKAEK